MTRCCPTGDREEVMLCVCAASRILRSTTGRHHWQGPLPNYDVIMMAMMTMMMMILMLLMIVMMMMMMMMMIRLIMMTMLTAIILVKGCRLGVLVKMFTGCPQGGAGDEMITRWRL
jgi:hypothetical protein